MKKYFGILMSLIVLILFFYVLKSVDFIEVYNLLLQANSFYFGLAMLCLFGSFLIWNLRWRMSLKSMVDVDYFFFI